MFEIPNFVGNLQDIALQFFLNLTFEVQIAVLGTVFLLLAYLYISWKNRYSRGIRLSKKYGRGTVYVLQDIRSPTIYKIGFTRRSVNTRRNEIERDMTQNRQLRIVFSVKVPHAEAVEMVTHRRLKRFQYRSRRCKGREWFRVPGRNGIAYVKANIEKSIEDIGRKKRSTMLNWLF